MTTYTNTINLQLFATLPANKINGTVSAGDMGTGNPNANLSPEMKTYYDMDLLDNAAPHLVHDQFGQKRPIPAGSGKVIEFRRFTALPKATSPIQEGITPNGQALEVTAINATVNQYGDFVTQTDVLELTAIDNTILEATKLLGNQAGVTLDTVVRDAVHAGVTNVTYCPKDDGSEVTSVSGLDNTCQLTVAAVAEVVAKLRAANAPTINGKYVAIAHPYVLHDLMRDPEWIDSHKYARPENLYEGEVGEVAGARFVQTSEAKVETGGVFATLIFGDDAYGVTEITGGALETIIKQKGSAGTADPLTIAA